MGERFREHQKAPSPIYDHSNNTGHQVTIDNFSIVGREDQNLSRAIIEALYIRVNNPSLNRNIRKYHLPHIWDEVLFHNSELKLKSDQDPWLLHLSQLYKVTLQWPFHLSLGNNISHYTCCKKKVGKRQYVV